jgi:hypothetical protein
MCQRPKISVAEIDVGRVSKIDEGHSGLEHANPPFNVVVHVLATGRRLTRRVAGCKFMDDRGVVQQRAFNKNPDRSGALVGTPGNLLLWPLCAFDNLA